MNAIQFLHESPLADDREHILLRLPQRVFVIPIANLGLHCRNEKHETCRQDA